MSNGVTSENNRVRKTPELIASIMKGGGHLLLVGEGMNDLPKSIVEHPQILIWDDVGQKGTYLNQEVPSNTKVIVYNRWISHALVKRLNNAAISLRAIKFPMMRNREIKELLAEFIQAEPLPISVNGLEKEVQEIVAKERLEDLVHDAVTQIKAETEPADVTQYESNEVKDSDMPKSKGTYKPPSPLRDFVVKHMNVNTDYTVKGSIVKEARRLFDKAEREGLKTTIASVNQSIYQIIKEIRGNKGKPKSEHGTGTSLSAHVPTPRTKKAKPETTTADDFEQLEIFIADAIAAMKLVQEHLPKVRKETVRLRSMKDKLMKVLG